MENNSNGSDNELARKRLRLRFAQAKIMISYRINVLKMDQKEAIKDVDIAFQYSNMNPGDRQLIGEHLLNYLAQKRTDGSNMEDNNKN